MKKILAFALSMVLALSLLCCSAMAEAVERDRKLERRLTTDVAHELRTPLMAIQATVEAMVDGVLPVDEQRLMTVDSEVMAPSFS